MYEKSLENLSDTELKIENSCSISEGPWKLY